MKITPVITSLCATVLIAAPGFAADPSNATSPAGSTAAAEQKVAPGDAEFVKKAAIGGMAEVKLGELAKSNAESQEVKDFGAKMVTDHSKANDDLKTIATSKGLTLPTELDAKQQAVYDRLSKLSGAEFDKAYVKDMVKDHKEDAAEFERASKSLKDTELKGFATNTLQVVKQHLEHVEKLSASMGHGKAPKEKKA